MIKKINKAAVIGSGVMGRGIAALLASVGVKTLLLDIVPPDLNETQKNNYKEKNRIAQSGFDQILISNPPLLMQRKDANLISIGNIEDDLYKIAKYDWIIEVVTENLKIKRNLFKRIESIKNDWSIVSSNTSGIPLSSISEGFSLKFKQNFFGTHFFNPVRYMKLLEIIPGEKTDNRIIEFMLKYGSKKLGKGMVIAKDTPNFIANRIGVQGIIKTMQLMIENNKMTIPEIDTLFGAVIGRPKTGMFKTADLVGIDILEHVSKNTYDLVHNDEARNDFILPDFVKKMISNGMLGKKTKQGFYKTELSSEWKIIRKVIDPKTLKYNEYKKPSLQCIKDSKNTKSLQERIKTIIYGDTKESIFFWKTIASNLIYSANRIPEISETIIEIDNAMKWGFNFELGPFETWDAIGLEKSVKKMDQEGFVVPEKIKKMLLNKQLSFYKIENGDQYFFDFKTEDYKKIKSDVNIISINKLKTKRKVIKTCKSASLIDIKDDILCLEFHTKMNIINSEIVDFIGTCIDFVSENAGGLVVGNQAGGIPGTFSAGGDLSFMFELAKHGKYSQIDSFLKTAQDGMQKARYSTLPIVVAPYGLALGGGCEICLGIADKIVAHSDLYMGLVEIGVGLLPGGGGCLNLWKKVINSIPESITDFDLDKFFISVFMSIAMAKISTSAAEAKSNGFLNIKDRIVFNRDHLIGEAKKEVIKMLNDGYSAPIKQPIRVFGKAAQGMINAEIFNMKSAKFISEYDSFLAKRIAYVISGGDIRTNSFVEEDTILALEREAFIDFWKQEKTIARVEHMLKTGKPLRN